MSKNKQYCPLLNWDKLNKTSNVDAEGNLPVQPNKGILFEDVIEVLLIAEYGEKQWRRTIRSHDGKRDFVYPYNPGLIEERWAECKNYTENISINTLSPTLFMAAIKNIPYVYFYSFSPLNDNALRNVVQYSQLTGKTVKVYDGQLLEACIFLRRNNPDIISKFGAIPDSLSDVFSRQTLRIVKTLCDAEKNPLSTEHKFTKGEKFFLVVTIQNLSMCSLRYHVDLKTNEPIFRYEELPIDNELEFGGIHELCFSCEAIAAGFGKYSIHLSCGELSETLEGNIDVDDAPYFYLSDGDALSSVDECVSALCEPGSEPVVLCGGSGYGKTTILRNVIDHNIIRDSFHVLHIQLNSARDVCIENMLSHVIGVKIEEHIPREQAVEDEILRPYLASYVQSAKKIVADLVKLMKILARPFLFVIDDAQNVTAAYTNFLRELRIAADGNAFQLLFSLNTDKMFYDDFLGMLSWDSAYENRPCKTISLKKFDRTKAIVYLKHRFGLKDIDSYFKGFDKMITPLELNRLSIDVCNRKMITKLSDGTYTLVDSIGFKNYLAQGLYANFSLADICVRLNQSDLPQYVLGYVYLVGYMSPLVRRRYNRTVKALIEQCVLKEEQDRIVFYHDTIREKASLLSLDYSQYADVCAEDIPIHVKALCALRAYEKLPDASQNLEEFFASNPSFEFINQRYDICMAVIENLAVLLKSPLAEKALAFVRDNQNQLSYEQSYERYYRFLERTMMVALETHWDVSYEICSCMSALLKRYFDRCLSTRRNELCLQRGLQIVKMTEGLQNFSKTDKAFWLSHFYNRMAIAQERLAKEHPDFCLAEKYYNLSSKYAKQAGNPPELLLQLIVDEINRYYVYQHTLKFDQIKNALSRLSMLDEEKIGRKSCLRYHICLYRYLTYKLSSVEFDDKIIEDLLGHIALAEAAQPNRFYEFKLLMLKAYLFLEVRRYADAYNFVSKAEQIAYEGEMRQNIYKLSYIKAQLLKFDTSLKFDNETSHSLSVAALLQFADVHKYDLHREIFLLSKLLSDISSRDKKHCKRLIELQPAEVQILLEQVLNNDATLNNSYFRFNGIDFPII